MIDYSVSADGIATISWNMADRPMNVLNAASISAFDTLVNRAIADPAVQGVIVTSARPDFLAGGDLDLIRSLCTVEDSMGATGPFSRTLRTLELCGKPFVAAVNGTALGGGLEICLACHYRIAADNQKTFLGLPEVSLGLLPAAGGTQRLPRMIGIKAALPYLLEGKKVTPTQALEAGIVDEVVAASELLERARAWLQDHGAVAVVKPWDTKGFRFPGGTPQSAGPMQIFFGAAGQLLGKTQGLAPAPAAILACIYDGCQVDINAGLKIEQRHFARLATSLETKNMIRTLFYSMGEANGLANRPGEVPQRQFGKVGVLGAGMMGAGVAYVCAQAGLEVVLLDTTQEALERGKAYGAKILNGLVAKGRMDQQASDATLARIVPTLDFELLRGCELVIEAVFEDREVKAEVTRKAEAVLAPDAVFATNTSTLSIAGLASVSARPTQFVGLHFFSPAEKMPLVEVVRGPQSGDTAVAHAMDFVKRIRKTPILVNDCPAFYANRAFGMYPYEAMTMLAEGVAPALIENAGRRAGMPMPPLALIDEFSVELLYKVMKQARLDQGDSYREQPYDQIMTAMVERFRRIGRKMGQGFYDYLADGNKSLWPGLAKHYPTAKEQPDVEEVRKRLMYSQSLEAARCVAEGIVRPKDADVGSILGWGFPAALGGAISYIDMIGTARFVAECDKLAERHGERFAVPAALRELASRGGRYLTE